MRAVRVHAYGGPEAMRVDELPDPSPGPGQVLVRVAAAGVNFIDTYHRTGFYKQPLPVALGVEGSGVVAALGSGVAGFAAGDRVAWVLAPGSYASHVLVPSERLVAIPSGMDMANAAAALEHGMTAHFLSHSTYSIAAGELVLVHAAAGGVGRLLVQLAKLRGAKVIATVGSAAKAGLAREAGADLVIRYDEQEVAPAVRAFERDGAHVVYDGVGLSTWQSSLDSCRVRGMVVFFGQSSGAVPAFEPGLLMTKGSLYIARPSLNHYTRTREEYLGRATAVLDWVLSGALKLRVDRSYPLAEAADAHRALEARATAGKVLLLP